MTNLCNDNQMPRLNAKMFDIRRGEVDFSADIFNKSRKGDIDEDYLWLLKFFKEDENENDNGNEGDNDEDEDEDEDEDAIEVENEDEDEVDPQYVMFMKNLTENGNVYKLKISKDDDDSDYLEYEKDEHSDEFDDRQTLMLHNGDKANSFENQRDKRRLVGRIGAVSSSKEVSRKEKINRHTFIKESDQGIVVETCYGEFLKCAIPTENPPVFNIGGNLLNYEPNSTSYDSDSELMIMEDAEACVEASTKQKEPSLKEKLIHILKKPYNRKEHKRLSKLLEQKKPICRLLPLRNTDVLSAIEGAEKSVLEDGPGFFPRKLEAAYARKDQHRALNILRMFRFWLQYLPDEEMFQPWLDKDILNVLRSR